MLVHNSKRIPYMHHISSYFQLLNQKCRFLGPTHVSSAFQLTVEFNTLDWRPLTSLFKLSAEVCCTTIASVVVASQQLHVATARRQSHNSPMNTAVSSTHGTHQLPQVSTSTQKPNFIFSQQVHTLPIRHTAL